MTRSRRGLVRLGVLALLELALLGSHPAAAQAKSERAGHDRAESVGAIVADVGDHLEWICSGTLVGPRIVLTAAHCLMQHTKHGVWVTFDAVVGPNARLYHGRGVPSPAFDPVGLREDVALVLLDSAPDGIDPARVAATSLLDRLQSRGALRGSVVTMIGYGVGDPTGTSCGGRDCGGVRRSVPGRVRGLTRDHLVIEATGDSALCSGDSGAPQFLGGTNIALSVTSIGDATCRSLDLGWRLDGPGTQAFLRDQGIDPAEPPMPGDRLAMGRPSAVPPRRGGRPGAPGPPTCGRLARWVRCGW